MTEATDLAMNLADLKLKIRQVTGQYKGKDPAFDAAIDRSVRELNKAIINSVEAVGDPNIPRGSRRALKDTPIRAAKRHAGWLDKQYQVGLRNRIKGHQGAQ